MVLVGIPYMWGQTKKKTRYLFGPLSLVDRITNLDDENWPAIVDGPRQAFPDRTFSATRWFVWAARTSRQWWIGVPWPPWDVPYTSPARDNHPPPQSSSGHHQRVWWSRAAQSNWKQKYNDILNLKMIPVDFEASFIDCNWKVVRQHLNFRCQETCSHHSLTFRKEFLHSCEFNIFLSKTRVQVQISEYKWIVIGLYSVLYSRLRVTRHRLPRIFRTWCEEQIVKLTIWLHFVDIG